jgi:hypothetical protein
MGESPKTVAEQLLALEAEGVNWSRNASFALFEQEGPRRARKLKRLLDALTDIIHRHQSDADFSIEVERVDGSRPYDVRLHVNDSSTFGVRLSPEELALLVRDSVVAAVLVEAGLSAHETAAI